MASTFPAMFVTVGIGLPFFIIALVDTGAVLLCFILISLIVGPVIVGYAVGFLVHATTRWICNLPTVGKHWERELIGQQRGFSVGAIVVFGSAVFWEFVWGSLPAEIPLYSFFIQFLPVFLIAPLVHRLVFEQYRQPPKESKPKLNAVPLVFLSIALFLVMGGIRALITKEMSSLYAWPIEGLMV